LRADYYTLISIVDESLTDPFHKLKCMLFAPKVQLLPDAQIGDIIRFHRLHVTTFHDTLIIIILFVLVCRLEIVNVFTVMKR